MQESPSSDNNAAAVAAAMQCLDAFMAAWNAQDIKALEETMNFPHVRLNRANALTISARGEVTQDTFDKLNRDAPSLQGWHHSGWDKRDIVAVSTNKVHVQTRFVRYRADGSVLSTFDSLYIVTEENGHWGVRFRSSFAP